MSVAEAPYVDPGTRSGPPDALVLDIGDGAGALLVRAPEEWVGAELDVTVEGAPRSHHRHLLIRRMRAVGRDITAGVLPSLEEGRYTVWGPSGEPVGTVEVTSGQVTSLTV